MKYLRRLIWYFVIRLLILSLILGLMMTVFYYAMNLTNIQIVLKDGMAYRARYVMGIDSTRKEMEKYFATYSIENDDTVLQAEAGNSPYKDYNVRGLDHRIQMGYLWVWPWDNTAQVLIQEQIPRIDGRVKGIKHGVVFGETAFVDCFVIGREKLLELLDWYANNDYLDLFEAMAGDFDRVNVQAFEFEGYAAPIFNKDTYFKANMDMLDPKITHELFSIRPIVTKAHDNQPAKFILQ